MAGSGAAHPSPICPAERPKGGAGAAPPGPAEQLQRLGTDCLWVSWEFRGEPQSPEGPFGGAAGRLRKLFAGQLVRCLAAGAGVLLLGPLGEGWVCEEGRT